MNRVTSTLMKFGVNESLYFCWRDASSHAISILLEGPNQVLLKVGRAVNLVKRIDEWSKQCGSKEVILRGWWPGTVEEDTSLIKGRVKAGEKGKYCHRLERTYTFLYCRCLRRCIHFKLLMFRSRPPGARRFITQWPIPHPSLL